MEKGPDVLDVLDCKIDECSGDHLPCVEREGFQTHRMNECILHRKWINLQLLWHWSIVRNHSKGMTVSDFIKQD